jgi:ubiquinone biosynthesis protein
MVDEFADTDLESFDTGALLDTITGGLEDEGYDIDPFLTNLGRGLITIEGTIKALSPRVNIMECITRNINTGFDPDSMERMLQAFLLKGIQGVDDLAGLPTKAVETLDMLQKSQLKLGGDFGVDNKTVKAVNYLARNVVLTIIAASLFLGACLLCSSGATAGNDALIGAGYAFGAVGFVLMIYIFVAVRKDGK